MYHKTISLWRATLERALQEDQIELDYTADAGNDTHQNALNLSLIAKSEGIWVGQGALAALSNLSRDSQVVLDVNSSLKDGDRFSSGETIAKMSGCGSWILSVERALINATAFFSGIATQTHALVQQVDKCGLQKKPRVSHTRKTIPGLRALSIYSVLKGGGYPHRSSLASGILIKENHIADHGGIREAVVALRRSAPHGLKIEIEVTTLAELEQALTVGVGGVLLDNFRCKDIIDAVALVKRLAPDCFVEVSGGINSKNISEYLVDGVDIISSGAITHSVRSCDFSLKYD